MPSTLTLFRHALDGNIRVIWAFDSFQPKFDTAWDVKFVNTKYEQHRNTIRVGHIKQKTYILHTIQQQSIIFHSTL